MNISGMSHSFTVDKSSIEYCPTHRGVAFSATLLMDNAPVGTINNTGVGGPTGSHLRSDSHELVSPILREAAKRANTSDEFFLDELMNEAEGV